MKVSELMNSAVVTIGTSDSCHEAVQRMSRHKIRHLPVVNANGALEGIVTDRDLRHHLFTPRVFKDIGSVSVQTLLKAVPVSDIMSSPVICAFLDDDVETAAQLMVEEKIGSAPVLDGGRLVGILTETDLLRQILTANSSCCPEVEEIIVSFP